MPQGSRTPPRALVLAYRRAEYRVLARPAFTLRPGRVSAALARLLRAHGTATACLITAHNPGSRRQSAARNRGAERRLNAALRRSRPPFSAPSRAVDPQGLWPIESGRLVLGLRQRDVLALARRSGQRAVLWAGPRARPRLLWA